jgi:hypothetical protein
MAKIDWKKLALKAAHFVVVEGEKEVVVAIRKAMAELGVHPAQVSLDQHDSLVTTVAAVTDILDGAAH